MSALALPVTFTDSEQQVFDALEIDRSFLEMVHRCSECAELILVADNGVWLDAKALDAGDSYPCPMGIMRMGSLKMACSMDPGTPGSRHHIHEHQPPEQ